ncbi:SusD/RagB family nutrient-binding outer membrane lipoprotein [Chitinophaga eiseniae]|uniref:SusD/RagB family nutrient-binding outer membrane lipoprotein n=1 Tax=Chitinophaga eiseniae TaxID=634771 RepID=A0A847SNU0_9BACT|nr:SusD/RagB family nutrient-binding outer membrane lipoprotein [Chitinophaga eiseniae]NLR80985.1 SusD/RagB family nutrient-binding outer membrane lipoprotein [Chitinophaga eiseniae]
MKPVNKSILLCLGLLLTALPACKKDLIKLNDNPNGSNPATINPNLVLSTVLTQAGIEIVTLGYQDMAGVMQHTQKDGWTTTHNEYDWAGTNSWTAYYDILRNNQLVYDRAVTLNNELQQGVSLVMKSMMFGLITDLWGDAPYTQALKGQLGGTDNTLPVYDPQQVIYTGILADLDKANTLLSKSKSEYTNPIDAVDVYYAGDPTKWRKMANSLALRYYMRLSEKLPDVAKAGIEKIAGDPAKYPIITDASEDAAMSFPGNSNADSWPANATYDTDSSGYRRLKMCNTLVTYLQTRHDPRLGVWANKVQCFLLVDNNLPPGTGNVYKPVDTVVNGESRKVRYISPDVLASKGLTLNDINQDVDYVGLPPAIPGPAVYNLSPDAGQASRNPHVSWLNDIYKQAKGPLLKARLISAAEVHFILAEAAGIKGWAAGDGETHYNAAIKASLTTWGLAGYYTAYISQPAVKYNHSQQQIVEQKWVASWTAATEAWADFKRTGYPQLHAGPYAKGPVVPVRLYYMLEERNLNKANLADALKRLEVTNYSSFGANGAQNSPWSKPWIIQGTGKPW